MSKDLAVLEFYSGIGGMVNIQMKLYIYFFIFFDYYWNFKLEMHIKQNIEISNKFHNLKYNDNDKEKEKKKLLTFFFSILY